jgi:hypothetical protein
MNSISNWSQIKGLERELAKAQKEIVAWNNKWQVAVEMAAIAENQRAALAEALASLLSGVKDGWFNDGKWWHTGIEQAEQTLAAVKGGSK